MIKLMSLLNVLLKRPKTTRLSTVINADVTVNVTYSSMSKTATGKIPIFVQNDLIAVLAKDVVDQEVMSDSQDPEVHLVTVVLVVPLDQLVNQENVVQEDLQVKLALMEHLVFPD